MPCPSQPHGPVSLCPSEQLQLTHTLSRMHSHTYSGTHSRIHKFTQQPSSPPLLLNFPLLFPTALPTAESVRMASLLHGQLLSLAFFFLLIQNVVRSRGHSLPVLLSRGCSCAECAPHVVMDMVSCAHLCTAVQILLYT